MANEKTPRQGTMRDKILSMLNASPAGLTGDEIAALIAEKPLAIRPRLTEMKKAGLLIENGETRKSASGRSAKVLVVAAK